MFELKIETCFSSGPELRQAVEHVAQMLEVGMTSGIIRDADGNKICEWRKA